jgi:hypothetical protein
MASRFPRRPASPNTSRLRAVTIPSLSAHPKPPLFCARPCPLRAASRGVTSKLDEAAAPAGRTRIRHSGDAGAPPGTNTSPCQELAEVFFCATASHLERRSKTSKRGPALHERRFGARRKAPARRQRACRHTKDRAFRRALTLAKSGKGETQNPDGIPSRRGGRMSAVTANRTPCSPRWGEEF